MVSYWLYVAVDVTLNTGKKASKMVDLIYSEPLKPVGRDEIFSVSILISPIAGYGPVCPVVCEGRPVRGVPIPIAVKCS